MLMVRVCRSRCFRSKVSNELLMEFESAETSFKDPIHPSYDLRPIYFDRNLMNEFERNQLLVFVLRCLTFIFYVHLKLSLELFTHPNVQAKNHIQHIEAPERNKISSAATEDALAIGYAVFLPPQLCEWLKQCDRMTDTV